MGAPPLGKIIPTVVMESPYSGDVERNTTYARLCMKDCLLRGEAPFASHLLYTQVLDDLRPEERQHGLWAGWSWYKKCDKVVVYTDYGISNGMKEGIALALLLGKTIEERRLSK